MTGSGSNRVRTVKGILWFLLGFAFSVAVARFLAGLGAVSNLSDRTPWGLWVGFDVMGGVALAAGGFVLAAIVYCLRREEFRPLVRPAVLTAFLGYVAVAVGLLFDLGRPWNIWRPMFFWQHHSVLFEVAWCVMLYTTVLALEFLPVPLESSRFQGLYRLVKKATLPLVVLGIMLSTLHQSSLGSLFLIAPGRVHPLWYSPILPVLFFLSAIGLGLGMVMVESKATAWLYRKEPEDALLGELGRPLAWVLLLYAVVRVADLGLRHQLVAANLFTWEGALFVFELGVSAILPAALLLNGVARRGGKMLGFTAALVVGGFVLHRLDVGGISGITRIGSGYVPSFEEIATSVGIVSAAILVFLFFVERFHVYEHPPRVAPGPEPEISPAVLPLAALRSSSGLFVLGVALAFALLPGGAIGGPRPRATPVSGARRVLAVRAERAYPRAPILRLAKANEAGAHEVLLIDGNREKEFVLFDHADHEKRLGPDSCARCHHMAKPNDRETSCSECHRDMYRKTDIFDHSHHVNALGKNRSCAECHRDANSPKDRAHTTPCLKCHRDMVTGSDRIAAPAPDSPFLAPGYEEAMHGLCRKCHEEEDAKKGVKIPTLALCSTCHPDDANRPPLPSRKEGR